uniref:Uncharacterized protein n=1 Tax=Kwoniella pini CBS 10737 TaxID=1296096 RepID=A0A1B9HX50_9TREE|nr:uncharacterized protein I206_05700 [Kwoniella pini CBS 10737]OCF47840.1 hypothetical protein I206_05700 [Kwoniella pini CBS 10737]
MPNWNRPRRRSSGQADSIQCATCHESNLTRLPGRQDHRQRRGQSQQSGSSSQAYNTQAEVEPGWFCVSCGADSSQLRQRQNNTAICQSISCGGYRRNVQSMPEERPIGFNNETNNPPRPRNVLGRLDDTETGTIQNGGLVLPEYSEQPSGGHIQIQDGSMFLPPSTATRHMREHNEYLSGEHTRDNFYDFNWQPANDSPESAREAETNPKHEYRRD